MICSFGFGGSAVEVLILRVGYAERRGSVVIVLFVFGVFSRFFIELVCCRGWVAGGNVIRGGVAFVIMSI